ncbi:hypothetical protein [Streptomyces malaysiensis]|uniref:hypothetical protein n=1 Tax=Streptomyces malaysiensis TaxID=92644 RepID=UPI002B2F5AA3|nr:hypothetical protein R8789_01590 [Streptomyces malaysiensis]
MQQRVVEGEVGQRHEHRIGVGGDDDRVRADAADIDHDYRATGRRRAEVREPRWTQETGEARILADLGEQVVVLGPQSPAFLDAIDGLRRLAVRGVELVTDIAQACRQLRTGRLEVAEFAARVQVVGQQDPASEFGYFQCAAGIAERTVGGDRVPDQADVFPESVFAVRLSGLARHDQRQHRDRAVQQFDSDVMVTHHMGQRADGAPGPDTVRRRGRRRPGYLVAELSQRPWVECSLVDVEPQSVAPAEVVECSREARVPLRSGGDCLVDGLDGAIQVVGLA